VSQYQKGKTNLDCTDSEWQWHQLEVCTLLQTDNHASNPSLSFLQAGCPSCRPTNSVKALKHLSYSKLWFKFTPCRRLLTKNNNLLQLEAHVYEPSVLYMGISVSCPKL